MENLVNDIPFGKSNDFNTIVEISQGTHHKYEYDEKRGVFALNRILFPAMSYPGNYGFIPQTISDDGDPVDILIVNSGVILRGTVVECYPIGSLHMVDDGKLDIKVVCMPTFHHLKSKHSSLMNFDSYFIDQIHHFFQHYKDLENKKVEIKGWLSPKETIELIEDGNATWKALNSDIANIELN